MPKKVKKDEGTTERIVAPPPPPPPDSLPATLADFVSRLVTDNDLLAEFYYYPNVVMDREGLVEEQRDHITTDQFHDLCGYLRGLQPTVIPDPPGTRND
ncbi:MAG: hypothetical protein GY719_36870 [bacterium]|nr:hypothetical protein [bacterium]